METPVNDGNKTTRSRVALIIRPQGVASQVLRHIQFN